MPLDYLRGHGNVRLSSTTTTTRNKRLNVSIYPAVSVCLAILNHIEAYRLFTLFCSFFICLYIHLEVSFFRRIFIPHSVSCCYVVISLLFYLCVSLDLYAAVETREGQEARRFFYDSDLMFWLPSIEWADAGRRCLRLIHRDGHALARTHTAQHTHGRRHYKT